MTRDLCQNSGATCGMRRHVLTLALSLWLLPGVPVADQGALPLWDALVVQQPNEPLSDARRRTLTALVELLDALEASFRPMRTDEESKRLLIAVAENLARLDLAKVHRLLPYPPTQDGHKAILLDMRRDGDGFALTPYDPNALYGTAPQFVPSPTDRSPRATWLGRRAAGERWALLGIGPPAVGNGNYTLTLQSGLRIGHGEPALWWRSLEGALRSFEDLARQGCNPTQAAREELGRIFPAARPCDLAVLENVRAAFPHTFTFAIQYLDIQQIGEWMVQHNAFKLNLAVQMRQDQFAQDYPFFATWFKRVAGLVTVHNWLHDSGEHLVSDTTYDSTPHRLTARAVFRAGRFLPCTNNWHPIADHRGYSFADPGEQHFRLHMSSAVKVAGIEVAIEDLAAPVTTRLNEAGFRWEQRIREMPADIRVTGSLFGIIPQWLVEFVLRHGLDQMLHDFLAATVHGPQGDGTVLSVAVDKQEENACDLATELSTEILNHGLLRLGFEFGVHSYVPDEAQWTDIRRFILTLLRHVRKDLTRQQQLWGETSRKSIGSS